MKPLVVVLVALALVPAFVPAGEAWLPVCKDKDLHVGGFVWVHVGVDCEPGFWVEVCRPMGGCSRHHLLS